MKRIILATLLSTLGLPASHANTKTVQDYLNNDGITQGIRDFRTRQSTNTAEQKFSLATLEFFGAIENLSQSLYKLGLNSKQCRAFNLPFLRLPIPDNPSPKNPVQAGDLRVALVAFQQRLQKVTQALDTIPDENFIAPVNLATIRLDINADGKLEADESFENIYQFYNRRALIQNHQLLVHFDNGDAYWLKGYAHLLLALSDILLAHDGGELFDYVGHLLFKHADRGKNRVLSLGQSRRGLLDNNEAIADIIASLHMMQLPVVEPKRLQSAHQHLLNVITLSQQTWRRIEQETDNDHEWLPNAKQQAVTGTTMTAEMIQGWKDFLMLAESILQGKVLIPHWRVADGHGINLKRVFYEPQTFDLILWAQGRAAVPYLERGVVTTPADWERLSLIFRGDFIGFAVWIN
jgi:hypothetical protein